MALRRVKDFVEERLRDPDMDAAAVARGLIAGIAIRWGFNEAFHFSRAFKQAYGCSPRDYRRKKSLEPPV